jgi:hypothetical protein
MVFGFLRRLRGEPEPESELIGGEVFEGSLQDFWNKFFPDVPIEVREQNRGLLAFIFSLLFALNLKGRLERERISIGDELRNRLGVILNELEVAIEELQKLQSQTAQPSQSLSDVHETAQSLLKNLRDISNQGGGLGITEIAKAIDSLNRLGQTLQNPQTTSGLTNEIKNIIDRIQKSYTEIKNILSQSIPPELTILYNVISDPQNWGSMFEDENLRENFGKGINEISRFLESFGTIKIKLDQDIKNQLIRSFREAGLNLDINNPRTRDLLGIRSENGEDWLVISEFTMYAGHGNRRETFLDILEREFSPETCENMANEVRSEIEGNQNRIRSFREIGNTLGANISELYDRVLNNYYQVELNLADIFKNKNFKIRKLFRSDIEKSLADDIKTILARWRRIRKALGEVRNVIRNELDKPRPNERLLRDLKTDLRKLATNIEEIRKQTETLKKVIANLPKHKNVLTELAKKMGEAGGVVFKILGTAGLGILGMFILGPWALNLLAAEIIERQLKKGSSSGK